MAILNVKSSKRRNYEYGPTDFEIIEIYIRYITRTRKEDTYPPAYVGYLGFKPYATVEELVNGFYNTQYTYKKLSGVRARHEWISFKKGETYDIQGRLRIVDIAYRFASWYYMQGFQVVFAIHTDSEFSHIHYVVNPVALFTGRKYHSNTQVLYNERMYLNDMINYITGRCGNNVELRNYTDSYSELLDERLLLSQKSLSAIHFGYNGKPEIVYSC